MSVQEINECPDCASPNIVHNQDREQIICRECGLIYEPLTPAEKAIRMVKKPAAKKAKSKKK